MKQDVPDGIGRVVAVVGGLVDEVAITLAIYGESLEPNTITDMLGVQPTSCHRRGERRGPRSPTYAQGAWFLSVRCESPVEPNEALLRLLDPLPDDDALWSRLASAYDVQLRLGVFFTGWNKGFSFSQQAVSKLARMRAKFGFDLYAHGEEDSESEKLGPLSDA